jgi:ABC transport system ATP-binding/permease protein
MNLISIEGISKSYSEKQLFSNISLGINEGDKIGIIGINGTGKTTLLKLIAGLESSDDGRIIKGNSVTIEYLPQNPDFNPEAKVIEQVFKGNSPVLKFIGEYEEAVQNPGLSDEKMMELTHKMDSLNAWDIESEAKAVLIKLGISDFEAKVGTLSGGQKKRIALAGALINPSDLLILDEPTNHLDNDTIDWLEQYLNARKGALLMITHDRYFLDRVVNEIIELDSGRIYTYKGNYSIFLDKKLEREEMESASEKKRQSLLRNELAWIKRGAKARTTKQKARIERFNDLNSQSADIDDEKLEISVTGTRLGKKVVELEHISKSFNNINIIDDFSYIVTRNDRIGIIGPNGCGKSTLINIICGRLKPDCGKVEIGETVKLGVYSQENYHMDESKRVIEYIKEGGEVLTTSDGSKISAAQMLERFLFSKAEQWTPISKLSGGEKRRLYLLRILMEGPNVLCLDEPTNDLDIETLTILEDYIEGFQGAVIAVSHDRYFLDKLSEKLFVFEGSGNIIQHTGNYSELKEIKPESKKTEKVKQSVERNKEKPLKFSYMEQREFEEIDSIIGDIEKKISNINTKIDEASSDYSLLEKLLNDKKELDDELSRKMERWVYLNDLADRIEKSR